ncbi:energy-coupling factor transporter transmembrane component T family protein [Guggenheimella bovis]
MMKDITLGQYYPADSIIHKLDPRVKLMGTMIFIIAIFLCHTVLQYAVVTALTLLLIFISKVPFKFVLKGLKPILFLLVFATIMNLFFTKTGKVLFSFWVITITDEGLIMTAEMIMRLTLLIMGTSLLTYTTSPLRLTDGLEKAFSFLKPLGFPAHELAMMMTIALRFIPTLMEETDKIMKAQMARGADFEGGNLITRAKSLIPLLVPLFISSFKRADELANAMEARGYQGGEGRTKLNPLKYEKRDFVAYAIIFIILGGIIGLGYV